MNEFEMYVALYLTVFLKDGTSIIYTRDERPDYEGHLYISEFQLPKSFESLIDMLEKEELLKLTDGDMIDIDEMCKELIERYGADFAPNEETKWYSFKDDLGMSGLNLSQYWPCFINNQKEKKKFLKKLKKIDATMVERIVVEKIYDSFDSLTDEDYENQKYTIEF